MRRMSCAVLCVVLFSLALAPSQSAAGLPSGVDVEWLAESPGALNGHLEIIWIDAADEATLSLKGPESFARPPWAEVKLAEGSFRTSFGGVLAGDRVTVPLDLSDVEIGDRLLIAAQRRVGEVWEQTVVELHMRQHGVELETPRCYRVTRENIESEPRTQGAGGEESAATSHSSRRGRLVIRPLEPKVQASVFGEDTETRSIPDGPGNCADLGGDYPVDPIMSMDAAPAGSIATAIDVHVVISHSDMSQLHVAFSEDDYFWSVGGGRYLLKNEPGNGLDAVFTEDTYGNDLPGIGLEVNGWFSLWVRDCVAGVTGTLDYWSVTVTYDGGPELDLVAESISISPDPVEPGGQADLTWQGRVEGNDPLPGPFDVGFYLSSDPDIDTTDTELDRVTVTTAVDPGDTFGGADHTVTIPDGLSEQTWYIGVIVDPDDDVDETNEDNNLASDSVGVASAPDLDLVADALTPQSTSVGAGETLDVAWSGSFAANSTDPIPGGISVGFYLSSDANVTTADQLLESVAVNGPLEPGDDFGESARQLVIPAGTTAGAWTLGVIVDDIGAVDESNESNNVMTAALTVTNVDTRPDLQIRSCAVSDGSVAPGEQVDVSWERRNAGASASGVFDIGVYLSADQTFDSGNDELLLGWEAPDWPGGQAWGPISTPVDIPQATAAGQWYLIVVLDVNQEVDETEEGNNLCAISLMVESGGGPEPVLYLIPAGASATGFNNSDWRTQVSIANATQSSRTATIHYVPDGTAWPGQVLSGPFQVLAMSSYFVDDLLAAMRPTTGLLYVELDAAGPVVTSRTYNRQVSGATFGQGIPAIQLVSGSAATELVLPLVHSVQGQFHSNLGIVQASAGSITVDIRLYSADGALLASGTRSVNDAWEQINDVFSVLGAGGSNVLGAWARVRLINGSPDSWACYASVVDKETGDPTYVIGVAPE